MRRHINAAYRVCDGLGQNRIVRAGKNSGPVLTRLLTTVHEILGQRRRPFVLSNALARLSISRFVQQKSSKNRTNVKVFLAPLFSGGTTPTSLRQIVSANYHPPFGKVWLSSVY